MSAIGAAGDRMEVLRDILSGVEDSTNDLIVPQLLNPVPNAPAEARIKTLVAGHMSDGGSATAFDVEPGQSIPASGPLRFSSVRYECKYARRYRLVPHEESRADVELPADTVTMYARVMSKELLRNRDLKFINAITSTTWGVEEDYSDDAGARQWNSDNAYPIRDLVRVFDRLPMQPTHIVMPKAKWLTFATHPNVLSTVRWTEDRAMLNQSKFQALIGDELGVKLVVQAARVHDGGPLDEVTPASLVRRLDNEIWIGTLANAPGYVRLDTRGRQEIVSEPTALAYVVEDELDYIEVESANPRGREMQMGMSYAITPVSTALGCLITNVESVEEEE